MNLTPAQVAALKNEISVGYIAIGFALEHWDLFRAWASEHSGEAWTDEDRAPMESSARVLYLISDIP